MLAELSRPMDLATGPLFRFHLVRNCPDIDHDLIYAVADHAVVDGWSVGIIRRDLIALIERAATGHGDLPPLPLTPAEIAAARRVELAGERGRTLAAYWQKTLAGMDLGELPAPRACPGREVAASVDA